MKTSDIIGRGLRVLEGVTPGAADALVSRLWFSPPKGRQVAEPSPNERITITHDGSTLQGFAVGDGTPALLVHGWGGNSGQMLALARRLGDKGYRAVSVDLPGHGDQRRRTDIFELASAVNAVIESTGHPRIVVAHSLGALIALLALRGDRPPAALVAPVLSVESAITGFGRMLELSPGRVESLRTRLRDFCGDDWDELNQGSTLQWGNDLLVVHDPGDRNTSFSDSQELATTSDTVNLLEAPGFGHNRILADEEIGTTITEFLISHSATRAPTGPTAAS